jgi:3-oxoadipate enol-lactonase
VTAPAIIPGHPALACTIAGGGPTVLFLHGIGGNRHNWDDQVAAVAAAGWRAVALDARGYGDSAFVPPSGFTDYADDVARVIRHLGGPAHMVGLSMGGRIALDLFARHRPLVASLVLADTSAGSAAATTPEAIAEAVALRARPLLEGMTPADIAPGIVAKIAGPEISATARQRLLDSHAALNAPAYLAALAAVIGFGDFPPWAGIDVPVQVMVGEHDSIAPPAHARAMAAAIPGARLAEIPGAGHVANIEAGQAFNAVLLQFLADQRVLA